MCLVVESGTDVRLVEGMAERFNLTVLARRILGGVEISQPPSLPLKLNVGPASRVGFAWFVLRFLHYYNFDHVVVQGYGLAALAANVAGRFSAIPTTMLVCSPLEAYYRCRALNREDKNRPFLRRELMMLKVMARVNAHLGSRYVVLSRYLASIVRSHGTHRPIHVVPVYGVDTKLFCPSPDPKVALRKRYGLPMNGSIIFFSSRIAPEKDAETLLRATRALLDAGREVWLLHRSGGFKTLLENARKFGLDGRVIATDAVNPKEGLVDDYRVSDVCVQASREEGLGFSALEAMACAVPVVAADVGGLKETVIDGHTGWRYSAGDSIGLANCIAAAIDDPEEATRRGREGREMVCLLFNRETAFSQFEAIVRDA
jgi:glycosyltransferase involved in cell wall biosynthesis